MNAILKPMEARLEAMTGSWLGEVARVEKSVYAHPWTQGNFADSVQAGYLTQVLVGGESPAELLGYLVAMKGVDEVHLLNVTVAPAHQQQGWARVMLDALTVWSRAQAAQWLWLEVRQSNARARSIYERYGFRHVGSRCNYYPLTLTQREDAVVMSMQL